MNYTIKNLRSHLATLLSAQLGTFANNQAGIWVGSNYPTGSPKGLICYLELVPEQVSSQSVTGDLRAITEHFVVVLVQFDRTKSCYEAMRLIQQNFSVVSCDVSPATESKLEQVVMRIKNTGFI